jgi:Ca-activated chloride channel family protein
VLDLVGKLKGDRIGLVAFSGTAFLECPLTLDYGAFRASLNTMTAGIIPRGGTNLAAAIETSLAGFEARQGKYEALILITDGEGTEGDFEAAAKKAAEQGVRIYTVGIGTASGELIPAPGSGESWVKNRAGEVVKSRLDEKTLQDIALATNGAYVHGAGASLGLDEIFDGHIAKMERRELQSTLQRRFENRFQIPLALALLLLLLEPLLGERRRVAAVALALALLFPRAARADQVGEGNRLYHLRRYDEAAQQYGDALVESPGSPLLRFNLAAAQYKQEKYTDAVASLEKIGTTGDASFDARVAYNLGNSLFRLAQTQDESQPQEAVKAYETALLAYKRAMGLDPGWTDPKANHEVAAYELEALKKRIEE